MLTIGFGTVSEYSRSRVPRPPQNRTTFILFLLPTADLSIGLWPIHPFRVYRGTAGAGTCQPLSIIFDIFPEPFHRVPQTQLDGDRGLPSHQRIGFCDICFAYLLQGTFRYRVKSRGNVRIDKLDKTFNDGPN